jgi:amidase
MARTVRDAALLLNAIAGSDPADPATREADARRTDYVRALDGASLAGKRIGVMRFATGFGTDAAFDEALATLKAQGAILVDIEKFEGRDEIGEAEFKVLLTEFKADLNAYLATTPPAVRTRTLADLIAFNAANAASEMPLFGQDLFEQAQASKGLDDPEYRKARELSFRKAGPDGDQYPGGGAGSLAAVAGYPHLTVPMGQVRGLPVGLSFIGAKWSDASILSLGHAYEQASRKLVAPRLLPSIEETPEVRRAFEPQP